MHTDLVTDGDGKLTQVGPDPLDYVLRYAVGDYDCYHRGRYVGSRPTLPKAIAAVSYEQEKAARHPLPAPTQDTIIAAYQSELRTLAARLHDLAAQLAGHPTESALTSTHLRQARISVVHALQNAQAAERSLMLACRAAELSTPLDTPARQQGETS